MSLSREEALKAMIDGEIIKERTGSIYKYENGHIRQKNPNSKWMNSPMGFVDHNEYEIYKQIPKVKVAYFRRIEKSTCRATFTKPNGGRPVMTISKGRIIIAEIESREHEHYSNSNEYEQVELI